MLVRANACNPRIHLSAMQKSANPSERGDALIRPLMPELDTLRGLAILGVLALHGFYSGYSGLRGLSRPAQVFLGLTQWGWLGVNLFFVLSGFLITGILLDSRKKPHYYRRFYARRALRILPAYYALLILLAVLRQATAAYLGLSFVYLANVTNLFGVAEDYGPLWSLAVEEHYYLAWPMVVRWLTRRNLALFALGICVAEPILRAIAFQRGDTVGLASYTWFVADGLASGSLLAILLRTSLTRRQVAGVCFSLFAFGAAAAAGGAPFGILTRSRLLGATLQHTVIDLLFSGVLLFFLLAGTAPWGKLVHNAGLRFVGRISYGLYLVHLLVFRLYDKLCRRLMPSLIPMDGHFAKVVLRFVVAGGGAIVIAYLSRRFFEERFLRLKDRWSPAMDEPLTRVSVRPEDSSSADAKQSA
jgi:peptidoglycan/LPS O-acetylase OafA/YrhL